MLRQERFNCAVRSGFFFFLIALISCDSDPIGPVPYNYSIDGPKDLFPAFSPDGEYVAYFHNASLPPDPDYPSGLYIVGRDGSNRKLVIPGEYFNSPSWSPDSDWLVFSAGGGLIQKCQLDGTGLETLTDLGDLDYPEFYYPDWTPDGSLILFDKPLGDNWGLYSVNHDFEDLQIAFGVELLGRNPELSVDGKTVLFSAGRGSGADVKISEIFSFDLATLIRKQLTNNDADNRAPTWSPDGHKIAWSRSVRLFTMNADGSNQRQLGYGNDPSWSVKNEIVFSHANSDYTREVLYVIAADGSSKRQITF